tara:strand:- start:1214 stop:1399 length:186 start_codon:yes stop_codon:yes gene_type:complete
MISEAEIEDTVIESYIKMYLNALNDDKPQEHIDNIHNRLLELLERKKQRKNLSNTLVDNLI